MGGFNLIFFQTFSSFSCLKKNPPLHKSTSLFSKNLMKFAPFRHHFLLINSLAWLFFSALLPGFSNAEELLTLTRGDAFDGSQSFAQDWARYRNRKLELGSPHLAVSVIKTPVSRLWALNRGRADFAIVDAATVTKHLNRMPDLVALAVLWPNYLHAINETDGEKLAQLHTKNPLLVAKSARYVFDTLQDWAKDKPEQRSLIKQVKNPTQGSLLPEDIDDGVYLFSAPAPLVELVKALEEKDLALRPIQGKLMEELQLLNPWLHTTLLSRETYPGMVGEMELPVHYQVLVSRANLPESKAKMVLEDLYGYGKRAIAPFNPLFKSLSPKPIPLFVKLFTFHPTTFKKYGKVPGKKKKKRRRKRRR